MARVSVGRMSVRERERLLPVGCRGCRVWLGGKQGVYEFPRLFRRLRVENLGSVRESRWKRLLKGRLTAE